MDSANLPNLIYLVLLGTAVAGWFIAENRQNLGKTARMGIAWGLIFLGVVAAYGLWSDIRDDVAPRQSVLDDGALIEVPRGIDGHFHLTLNINGAPVEFLVDTGATDLVLTLEDAKRVGLDPDNLAFIGQARTANGIVKTAFATVENVTLGPIQYNRVRVSVNGGDMDGSLLGMSFLSRFNRFEISGNTLRLEP